MAGVTELGSDEIHIRYRLLDNAVTESQLQAWLVLLSDDEKDRYRRFYFEKDRVQFAAAHALVRQALSDYFAVAPGEWRFEVNAWGKPRILNPEGKGKIGFNLSHTQGLVACAVACTENVGMDVEWMDRRNSLGEIARHAFSPSEAVYFEDTEPGLQRDVFFRLWTLKEAYIKARGEGLSIPLDSFSFRLEDAACFVDGSVNAREWSFFEYQPSLSHRMAVAIQQREPVAWRVKLMAVREMSATLEA